MRNVQLLQDDVKLKELAEEAAAGEPVTLLQGDRPIAQIIAFPAPAKTVNTVDTPSREEREAALVELQAIMDRGYDLGIVWNGRAELYERDGSSDARCKCTHLLHRPA